MTGTYITIGRPIKCRVRAIRPFCSIYSTRLPVLGFILFQLKFEKTERTFSSDKKRSIFIKIARVNVISFFPPVSLWIWENLNFSTAHLTYSK